MSEAELAEELCVALADVARARAEGRMEGLREAARHLEALEAGHYQTGYATAIRALLGLPSKAAEQAVRDVDAILAQQPAQTYDIGRWRVEMIQRWLGKDMGDWVKDLLAELEERQRQVQLLQTELDVRKVGEI